MKKNSLFSFMRSGLVLLLLWGMLLQVTSCKNVETVSPVRKDLELAVFANGFVERDEEYTVSANAAGVLHGLVVGEGDSVNTATILATVDDDAQLSELKQSQLIYEDARKNAGNNSTQLAQLQQQLAQATAQLGLDEANYLRYKDLNATSSVSRLDFDKVELQYRNSLHNLEIVQQKYDETKAALRLNANTSLYQLNTRKAVLNDYRIKAGNAGTVISIYKRNGEMLRSGDAVAKIGSGGYLLKLYVSEDDIVKVRLQQQVAVHLNTYPDSAFTAAVTKIYPGFDNSQQSYIVEARFKSLPEQLFSGTQLQANIKVEKRTNVLVVPSRYLLKNSTVQLKDGTSKAVTTGAKDDQWTEIITGLSEADLIRMPQN
ncbi:efflux RND transporter periplasmic adaptor subunit [Filimonas effusa]|nr:HlyD family efflux transporter periplasmic adaptor subunit [Filimonas effusa]